VTGALVVDADSGAATGDGLVVVVADDDELGDVEAEVDGDVGGLEGVVVFVVVFVAGAVVRGLLAGGVVLGGAGEIVPPGGRVAAGADW